MAIKLSQELLHSIDENLRALNELPGQFDRAEQCGIDCNQFRRERDEMVKLLTNFKQNYG